MANIPVEKTSTGAAWLPWLLGILALLALGWLVFALIDDPDVDDADEVAVVDDDRVIADDDDMMVDDDVMVAGAGAFANLSNLYVTRVTGDRTFYVSPMEGSSDEMLVILDQNMSPDAPGIEGQVDINPGQTVDLSDGNRGMFGDDDVLELGLDDDDANRLTSDTEVIRIDGGDVEILTADMNNVEVQ